MDWLKLGFLMVAKLKKPKILYMVQVDSQKYKKVFFIGNHKR